MNKNKAVLITTTDEVNSAVIGFIKDRYKGNIDVDVCNITGLRRGCLNTVMDKECEGKILFIVQGSLGEKNTARLENCSATFTKIVVNPTTGKPIYCDVHSSLSLVAA